MPRSGSADGGADPPATGPHPARFVTETVLKRDVFSETGKGAFADAPDRVLIRRSTAGVPWWSRPLARWLARSEERVLRAADGIAGLPRLVAVEPDALVRTWIAGVPLHIARPSGPDWYRDAARLLRELRRAGITHNDLAKPQNWLVTAESRAAVIDFQLARVHRRRGWRYRLMAYEDLRHLLKHKRAYARGHLTPTEARMVTRRSFASRLWLATGKPIYRAATRGVGWSDREGGGARLQRDGPATRAALMAEPGVADVALVPFPLPARDTGLYAFCEAAPGTDPETLARGQRARGGGADLVQVVDALPRAADGTLRDDILRLVALNQVDQLARLAGDDPVLAALAERIAAGRLNLGDRRLRGKG